MTTKAKKPLDPETQKAVNHLAASIATILSNTAEFGMTEGLKLFNSSQALKGKNLTNEVIVQFLSKFCQINPHAEVIIETAYHASPALRKIIDRLNIRVKPVDDPEIKDAEPC